jgi:hypothetical protein
MSGRGEGIFAQTADGTYPVFRDILPGCAGGDAAVGIADFRIIDIAAGTFVLHDDETSSVRLLSARRSVSENIIIKEKE